MLGVSTICYVLIFLAALCGFFACFQLLKLFSQKSFFRGSYLICLLALSLSFAHIAYQLGQYEQLLEGDDIATLSIKKISSQRFKLSLIDMQAQSMRDYVVSGDSWQLDAKVLQLKIPGLTAIYLLDRLSARYDDISQEKTEHKSVYSLTKHGIMPKLWRLFQSYDLGFVGHSYGSAVYAPMADGARYAIAISITGLMAKPLNNRARRALKPWLLEDTSSESAELK